MRTYPIKYNDNFGEEESKIYSDGSTMYLKLRGIDFEGNDFEGLEGKIDQNKFNYELYENGYAELTNFRMEIEFPIKIHHLNNIVTEKMKCTIEVGEPLKINVPNTSINNVELNTSFGKFTSLQKIEWFEETIIEIQNLLPEKTQIKACISCKYSNYHPVGNGMFGSLFCFKKIKSKLNTISDKHDLMNLWDEESIKNKDIYNVQEIFDCSEHQFITKEDWTYKDWDYKTNCV